MQPAAPIAAPPPAAGLFQRRIITPLIDLLRMGASPEKLAWSLAVGVAVGINPLLGSTTLVCLAVAWVLRLNLIASQLTNHLAYPLEVALFFPFIHLGILLFHTGALPLERHTLFESIRHHPLETTRLLWSWEWHALVVWALAVTLLTPALAVLLRYPLRRLLLTLHSQPPAQP